MATVSYGFLTLGRNNRLYPNKMNCFYRGKPHAYRSLSKGWRKCEVCKQEETK